MAEPRRIPYYRLVILRDESGWHEKAEQVDDEITVSGWMVGEGGHDWRYHVPPENGPALIAALGGQPGDDVLTLLQRYVEDGGSVSTAMTGLATFSSYWDG
jgi:hypothetical protein